MNHFERARHAVLNEHLHSGHSSRCRLFRRGLAGVREVGQSVRSSSAGSARFRIFFSEDSRAQSASVRRDYRPENEKSPWTHSAHGPWRSMCLRMHPTTPPMVGTSSLQAGLLAHGSSCSRAFPEHSSPSGTKRLSTRLQRRARS